MKHKRKFSKYEWVEVDRKRMRAPYTFDFIKNLQLQVWFDNFFKRLGL